MTTTFRDTIGLHANALILRENSSEIMNIMGEHIAEIALRPDRLGPALAQARAEGSANLAALDAFLVDTAEALSALPQLRITEDQAHRLRMGNPIILRGRDAPVAEPEAVALAGGKLIAIGEIAGGEFHPRRVFA